MSANTSPIYPGGTLSSGAHLAAANTARDGSGTLETLASGGVNGGRIDRIQWKAQGLTHGTILRFWLHDSGGNNYLLHEERVSATAPGGTDRTTEGQWLPQGDEPLVLLGSNCELHVSCQTADVFDVLAFGGNY